MSTTTSAVTIVPTVTLVIILPNIRITPTVAIIIGLTATIIASIVIALLKRKGVVNKI
jgi:hypothetical protein